jgi:hypothetical protein
MTLSGIEPVGGAKWWSSDFSDIDFTGLTQLERPRRFDSQTRSHLEIGSDSEEHRKARIL